MSVIKNLRTEQENGVTTAMEIDTAIAGHEATFSARVVEDNRIEVYINGSYISGTDMRYDKELVEHDLYSALADEINETIVSMTKYPDKIPETYTQYLNGRLDAVYENAIKAQQEQEQKSSMTQERANELFQGVLDSLHFSLEYDERYNGYLVYDEETKEYRGEEYHNDPDAENAAMNVCCTSREVIDELEGYVVSSFVDDMTDELESYGLDIDYNGDSKGVRIEIPQTIEGILEIVQKWENLPETTTEGKFYKEHKDEIAMMDLIANHIDEVDLDVIYRSEPSFELADQSVGTFEIAKTYGIEEKLKAFTNDLLKVDGVVDVEFDLHGFSDDMQEVIFLPKHDIPVEAEDYYARRSAMLEEILNVASEHGLTRTDDRIEDYGEHFYIVTNHDNSWEKARCIMCVDNGLYVMADDDAEKSYRLVEQAEATVFYDRNDAECVLEYLNDTQGMNFAMQFVTPDDRAQMAQAKSVKEQVDMDINEAPSNLLWSSVDEFVHDLADGDESRAGLLVDFIDKLNNLYGGGQLPDAIADAIDEGKFKSDTLLYQQYEGFVRDYIAEALTIGEYAERFKTEIAELTDEVYGERTPDGKTDYTAGLYNHDTLYQEAIEAAFDKFGVGQEKELPKQKKETPERG